MSRPGCEVLGCARPAAQRAIGRLARASPPLASPRRRRERRGAVWWSAALVRARRRPWSLPRRALRMSATSRTVRAPRMCLLDGRGVRNERRIGLGVHGRGLRLRCDHREIVDGLPETRRVEASPHQRFGRLTAEKQGIGWEKGSCSNTAPSLLWLHGGLLEQRVAALPAFAVSRDVGVLPA